MTGTDSSETFLVPASEEFYVETNDNDFNKQESKQQHQQQQKQRRSRWKRNIRFLKKAGRLIQEWIYAPIEEWYMTKENELNMIVVTLINCLHVSYVFMSDFSHYYCLVLSCLMSAFSVWNAVSLFTTMKTYQIVRKNAVHREQNANLVTNKRLVKLLKRVDPKEEDKSHPSSNCSIWKVQLWNYSQIQKLLFMYVDHHSFVISSQMDCIY